MKALQIFKAGKRTASDGRALTFTEADLKATAAAYDPALHEAPLVIGHPKTNDPAFGWTKSLAFGEGGLLVAEPHQVNPEFAELVNSGAFKKISASFYVPDSPDNPKPGVYYLRHVGFLGAQAPAVKGLKPAEFAADEKGVVEFMDWSDRDNASLWRSLRDWIIGKFGKDEADKVVPDYLVTSLQESAVTQPSDLAPAGADVNYSEKNDVEKAELERRERELKAQKEEHDRKAVEFAEREKKLQEQETARRRDAIATKVKALVAAGKVLPKDEAAVVEFAMAQAVDGTIEFGEGDKKVKKPAGAWFLEFLEALPKRVDFKERGAGADPASPGSDPLAKAAEISRRAVEFQEAEKKAGRTVNIAEAVAHVSAQAAQ